MKKLLIFVALLLAGSGWGQMKYYKGIEGQIVTEQTFDSIKQALYDAAYSVSKSADVKIAVAELYKKPDSIVYSYTLDVHINSDQLNSNMKRMNQNITTELNELPTLDGPRINLGELLGKPTLVNFWYIRCKPCVEEIPLLNKMKEKYGDRMNFIAVTYDKASDVRKFLKKHPFNFQLVTDAKNTVDQLLIDQYPTTIFLDAQGNIVEETGGVPYRMENTGEMVLGDESFFENIIEKLLK